MKDTSPEMEELFRKKVMARTGVERLKMGCSMFDTAKELIHASFRNQGIPLAGPEYREKLFLRTYGTDFDDDTLTKIVLHLKSIRD